MLHEFSYYYKIMSIYGSKFLNLGGVKNILTFCIWKNLKNQHLMAQQMANRWYIQKSE